MKGNITNRWTQQLRSLLRDKKQARCFAKIFLGQLLEQEIQIERLLTKLPDTEGSRDGVNGVAAVLDLWVTLNGKKRNIEIEIYEKQSKDLSQSIFSIHYYCVEAPAILIDSGVTKIRVLAGKEMEDPIREARKFCGA